MTHYIAAPIFESVAGYKASVHGVGGVAAGPSIPGCLGRQGRQRREGRNRPDGT